MKHPAIIQLRGEFRKWINELLPVIERTCGEFYVEKVKGGLDVYVSDVNEARNAISKIQRIKKAKIQMSTKYAGLRKGRVRTLFVYCLRF